MPLLRAWVDSGDAADARSKENLQSQHSLRRASLVRRLLLKPREANWSACQFLVSLIGRFGGLTALIPCWCPLRGTVLGLRLSPMRPTISGRTVFPASARAHVVDDALPTPKSPGSCSAEEPCAR